MNNMRVPLKLNGIAYNLIVTNAVTALLSATEDSNWTSDEKWLIFFTCPTKMSDTLKHFVGYCWQTLGVYLTISWDQVLKGWKATVTQKADAKKSWNNITSFGILGLKSYLI